MSDGYTREMTEDLVKWRGVVDFNGWARRPHDESHDVETKTERVLDIARQVERFHASGEPGALHVKWEASDDENAAFRTLFELTGIDPGDFEQGQPPYRV